MLLSVIQPLKPPPEGETTGRVWRVESLGFFYGRSNENIVRNIVDCSANAESCACKHMPIVEIGAVAVDGADIKAEIKFCLLLWKLRRKFIAEIPAVCSHQRDLAIEAAYGVAAAHADHIHAIEPLLVHRPLPVKRRGEGRRAMAERKRMDVIHIKEPQAIARLRRIRISLLLLRPQLSESETVSNTEIKRILLDIEPLCIADFKRCLVHRLDGKLHIVDETMGITLLQTNIHACLRA